MKENFDEIFEKLIAEPKPANSKEKMRILPSEIPEDVKKKINEKLDKKINPPPYKDKRPGPERAD